MMVLAILQARMSSTRLPNKVVKPILGQPMILRQVERIKRSKKIDRLMLATSKDPSDDVLADLCEQNNIECFRGSLDDVLDRFYQGARRINPDHVVRLTGDCPLTDPALIDDVIGFHIDGGFDYTSNALEPSFPDGLDVEVMTLGCLRQAWEEASLPSQREHVSLFIYQRPERFKVGVYRNDTDRSDLRWTVDDQADFAHVTAIYEALYNDNPEFDRHDILSLLERHPELDMRHVQCARNEGLEKSLREDPA